MTVYRISLILNLIKKSNHITVKFESGWITRRKCHTRTTPVSCVDHLTGETIEPNEVHYMFAIKRHGYGTYRLKVHHVEERVSRKYLQVYEDSLQQELSDFINKCKDRRKGLDNQEKCLREGLREVKFRRSNVGRQLSVANNLLELITKENKV